MGNQKGCTILPKGPTIAVQWEDDRPQIHWTVLGHGSNDHIGRSYRIWITKKGAQLQGKKYVKAYPISVEDYLRNKVWKAKQANSMNRFNELTDHLTQLHKMSTPTKWKRWEMKWQQTFIPTCQTWYNH